MAKLDDRMETVKSWVHSVQYMYRLETRENTMGIGDYNLVIRDYTMAMRDYRLETRENTMAMWHYTVGSTGKSPSQEGKGHGGWGRRGNRMEM